MKTGIKTLGPSAMIAMIALTALGTVVIGCSAPKVDTNASPPQRATRNIFHSNVTPKEAKITAPVQLSFSSVPSAGSPSAVVLTLSVRALTDIPSGVARVVLPSEVKLLSGEREIGFGALPKGAERQFSLTVDAAANGRFQIFAGVDCHISSGIQLHKEARPIFVGQTPSTPN